MRTLLLACFFTLTTHAAPVPPFRPKPPPQVTAGEYVLTWSATDGDMTLAKNGDYRLVWCGREYLGRWCWEAKRRALIVDETSDGGATWAEWSAKFPAESLAGKGAYAGGWFQTPPNLVSVALKKKGVSK